MPSRRRFIGQTTAAMAGPAPHAPLTVGPDRLRAMDSAGIDVEVLSINPFGASQVVIGTDYPFPWTATPDDARLPRFDAVDHVLDAPGLSDADRAAILGGNAARLFDVPL